jgi:hypothetical protein
LIVCRDVEALIGNIYGVNFPERGRKKGECLSNAASQVDSYMIGVRLFVEIQRQFFLLIAFENIEDFLLVAVRDPVPVRFFIHISVFWWSDILFYKESKRQPAFFYFHPIFILTL